MDLANFTEDDVDIYDIAYSLSRQVRFDGHGEIEPLNVLQHSLMVADILEEQGCTLYEQIIGLIHDAREAYLGDIGTPVKRLLNVTDKGSIADAVTFALMPQTGACFMKRIKQADIIALDIERRIIWDDGDQDAEYHNAFWPMPDKQLSLTECERLFWKAKDYQSYDFIKRYFSLMTKYEKRSNS